MGQINKGRILQENKVVLGGIEYYSNLLSPSPFSKQRNFCLLSFKLFIDNKSSNNKT